MPLQLDCGEVPCDPTCHSYYDMVGDVVRLGYSAMCEILPEEACEGITGFVTIGEPSFLPGDYLAGWLVGLQPYNPRNSQAGDLQMVPRKLATVGLKLLENGWPQPGTQGGTDIPHPSEFSAASVVAYEHFEMIERRLTIAVATRQLGATTGCVFMGLQRSEFIQPSTGQAGWRWTIQVEAP